MMSMAQFRALEWRLIYVFDGARPFKIFESPGLEGLVVTHTRRAGKTWIAYRVGAQVTDSPSQAVRWLNKKEKADGSTRSKED